MDTYVHFRKRQSQSLSPFSSHSSPSLLLHSLSLFLTRIFPRCTLIHSLLHTTPVIPTLFPPSHALSPLALPFSPAFLSYSHSLSLSLSVLLSFFFILETIQIPSIMLELQKPGQSAATSEAPGIAARYDSANTTTTRPLHESNS